MNGDVPFELREELYLGKGRRRRCYRLPDSDLCVKFYHNPADMAPKLRRIAREISWRRFLRPVNVNYREWRYHQEVVKHLPDMVREAFPEHTELVYCPEKGWGIIASLIRNADGSHPKRVTQELTLLADDNLCLELYHATARLCHELTRLGVRFFDHANILVQWTDGNRFRLRIVDFEPECRSPIPGLEFIGFYVRYKCQSRVERYLAKLRELLEQRQVPEKLLPQVPPTRKRIFKRFAAAMGMF